jgi:hypothetical protein
VIVLFAVSWLFVSLLTGKKKLSGRRKAALSVLLSFLLIVLACFGYFSVNYHADETAKHALSDDGTVTAMKENGVYFFDGPGEDRALIFYPGAKVEAKAYAPLMREISRFGIDCFLVEMPLNFALLGIDRADEIISRYHYEDWILSGHSLGGVAASDYASKHPEEVDEIILLASYPNSPLSENQRLLLIYGSEDGCLEKEQYENSRNNWPADSEEIILEGGNHAQFGSYGKQKGDGEATVSPKRQIADTVEMILIFEED